MLPKADAEEGGWVCKGARKGKGKGKQRDSIGRLTDLPENWWRPVKNDPSGYQMITETYVLGQAVRTLLDTGASVNAVTEELLVGIINRAKKMGLKSTDPDYPIVQLERWQRKESVAGVARDSPVRLVGAVVLRVRFASEPSKKDLEVLMRFKIFSMGSCDWHGFILSGRTLDVQENGGLGCA